MIRYRLHKKHMLIEHKSGEWVRHADLHELHAKIEQLQETVEQMLREKGNHVRADDIITAMRGLLGWKERK